MTRHYIRLAVYCVGIAIAACAVAFTYHFKAALSEAARSERAGRVYQLLRAIDVCNDIGHPVFDQPRNPNWKTNVSPCIGDEPDADNVTRGPIFIPRGGPDGSPSDVFAICYEEKGILRTEVVCVESPHLYIASDYHGIYTCKDLRSRILDQIAIHDSVETSSVILGKIPNDVRFMSVRDFLLYLTDKMQDQPK